MANTAKQTKGDSSSYTNNDFTMEILGCIETGIHWGTRYVNLTGFLEKYNEIYESPKKSMPVDVDNFIRLPSVKNIESDYFEHNKHSPQCFVVSKGVDKVFAGKYMPFPVFTQCVLIVCPAVAIEVCTDIYDMFMGHLDDLADAEFDRNLFNTLKQQDIDSKEKPVSSPNVDDEEKQDADDGDEEEKPASPPNNDDEEKQDADDGDEEEKQDADDGDEEEKQDADDGEEKPAPKSTKNPTKKSGAKKSAKKSEPYFALMINDTDTTYSIKIVHGSKNVVDKQVSKLEDDGHVVSIGIRKSDVIPELTLVKKKFKDECKSLIAEINGVIKDENKEAYSRLQQEIRDHNKTCAKNERRVASKEKHYTPLMKASDIETKFTKYSVDLTKHDRIPTQMLYDIVVEMLAEAGIAVDNE